MHQVSLAQPILYVLSARGIRNSSFLQEKCYLSFLQLADIKPVHASQAGVNLGLIRPHQSIAGPVESNLAPRSICKGY